MESIIQIVQTYQVPIIISVGVVAALIILIILTNSKSSTSAIIDRNLYRGKAASTPWLALKYNEHKEYYHEIPLHIETQIESGRYYKRY